MIKYIPFNVNDYCGWGHRLFISNLVEFKVIRDLAIGVKDKRLCYWLARDIAHNGSQKGGCISDLIMLENVLVSGWGSYWCEQYQRLMKGRKNVRI